MKFVVGSKTQYVSPPYYYAPDYLGDSTKSGNQSQPVKGETIECGKIYCYTPKIDIHPQPGRCMLTAVNTSSLYSKLPFLSAKRHIHERSFFEKLLELLAMLPSDTYIPPYTRHLFIQRSRCLCSLFSARARMDFLPNKVKSRVNRQSGV